MEIEMQGLVLVLIIVSCLVGFDAHASMHSVGYNKAISSSFLLECDPFGIPLDIVCPTLGLCGTIEASEPLTLFVQ